MHLLIETLIAAFETLSICANKYSIEICDHNSITSSSHKKKMKNFISAALLAAILMTSCKKTKSDRQYQVNTNTSVVGWKGSAPTHFHVGSFDINGNIVARQDGSILSGKFIIPIVSIKNFDLPDGIKNQLLDHLKTADFFNMMVHPNAYFEIINITPYSGNSGITNANKLVTGNFSMVGQTHPVTFPARIDYVGDSLKVKATLSIDRTKWGMTKFNDPLATDYLLPNADISLDIQAAKQ